jgi:hypothetical protein
MTRDHDGRHTAPGGQPRTSARLNRIYEPHKRSYNHVYEPHTSTTSPTRRKPTPCCCGCSRPRRRRNRTGQDATPAALTLHRDIPAWLGSTSTWISRHCHPPALLGCLKACQPPHPYARARDHPYQLSDDRAGHLDRHHGAAANAHRPGLLGHRAVVGAECRHARLRRAARSLAPAPMTSLAAAGCSSPVVCGVRRLEYGLVHEVCDRQGEMLASPLHWWPYHDLLAAGRGQAVGPS